MKRFTKNRKGLTVAELLVCVFIISITFALIFYSLPTVSKRLSDNRKNDKITTDCSDFYPFNDCTMCYPESGECINCTKICRKNEYKDIGKCLCIECSKKYNDVNCIKCDENTCLACNNGYKLDESKKCVKIPEKIEEAKTIIKKKSVKMECGLGFEFDEHGRCVKIQSKTEAPKKSANTDSRSNIATKEISNNQPTKIKRTANLNLPDNCIDASQDGSYILCFKKIKYNFDKYITKQERDAIIRKNCPNMMLFWYHPMNLCSLGMGLIKKGEKIKIRTRIENEIEELSIVDLRLNKNEDKICHPHHCGRNSYGVFLESWGDGCTKVCKVEKKIYTPKDNNYQGEFICIESKLTPCKR